MNTKEPNLKKFVADMNRRNELIGDRTKPYKLKLSLYGKQIFIGGNIEPMSEALGKRFKSKGDAEFYRRFVLGTSNAHLYEVSA